MSTAWAPIKFKKIIKKKPRNLYMAYAFYTRIFVHIYILFTKMQKKKWLQKFPFLNLKKKKLKTITPKNVCHLSFGFAELIKQKKH